MIDQGISAPSRQIYLSRYRRNRDEVDVNKILLYSMPLVFFSSFLSAQVLGELGPLEFDEPQELMLRHNLQALRVYAPHQNMEFSFELTHELDHAPSVTARGPLANYGDDIALDQGELHEPLFASHGKTIHGTVKFSQPGLYRILMQLPTSEQISHAPITVTATCIHACAREAIPMSTIVQNQNQDGSVERMLATFKHLMPTWSSLVFRHQDSDAQAFSHGAIVSLSDLQQFGRIIKEMNMAPPKPDLEINGNLLTALGACDEIRATPQELAWLPKELGLKYGHFHDYALTACQNAHSIKLAQILTSLAIHEDSIISYGDDIITSPATLLNALIATGHRIELREEKTIANFLSLTLNNTYDVIWPTWIKTDLVADGIDVTVPAMHSQLVWRITGPDVNARVGFFHSTNAAAFHAMLDARPLWLGKRVSWRAPHGDPRVIDAITHAAEYLYLNRQECHHNPAAQTLPGHGYGVLGICNDSVAFVEKKLFNKVTTFPLVRSLQFEVKTKELADAFAPAAIPNDTEPNQSSADLIRRIYDMRPFEVESSSWFDEDLRNLMRAIKIDVEQ